MLTVRQLEGLKPKDKKYKTFDMEGLYIEVLPSGTKSWRYNYKHLSKNLTKTYGNYPSVSLIDVRRQHTEFRANVGDDALSKVKTFKELRDAWLKFKTPQLKNKKHQLRLGEQVGKWCAPLNDRPIDQIKKREFVNVVQAVQQAGKIETGRRMGMYLRQMFDYAVDCGDIESHAASGLSRVLMMPAVKKMNCVAIDEAPALFKSLLAINSEITRLGILMAANTFVRTNEVRFMRWDELMLDKRIWLIPADKMKMKKPHVVPLSDQVMAYLERLKELTGKSEYVFASPTDARKPISENTLLDALYALGYKGRMTVHGFRALASTVLNSQSDFHADVIERQLAHKEKDSVRAAYHRAEYLPERIQLMQWYSDWITQQTALADRLQ